MIYIYSTLITLGLSIAISAQVAIGKDAPLSSSILDFENPATGGIALPKIISLDAGSVPGTLYFNTADGKVKFKLASEELDLNNKNSGTAFDVNEDGYENLIEEAEKNGTVIGNTSSDAPGTLVLESLDMALIVPNVVNPLTDIKSPEPGMIAYDSTNKLLCVFDGAKWSFWGEKGLSGINNQ